MTPGENKAGIINFPFDGETKALFNHLNRWDDRWLVLKGFVAERKEENSRIRYWRRVNKEGAYLDNLTFRTTDIAAFGRIGIMGKDGFVSIMQNDKLIFYREEIELIYLALAGEVL